MQDYRFCNLLPIYFITGFSKSCSVFADRNCSLYPNCDETGLELGWKLGYTLDRNCDESSYNIGYKLWY